MKRLSLFAMAFATMCSSLGCTFKTVDGPVTVTTKQLPEASKPSVQESAKEVSGSSCTRVVLLIIPVGIATAEGAYSDALAQAPGADTLLDYQARVSGVFITPFYYQVCTEVHGFAISSKAFVAAANDKGAALAKVEDSHRKWEAEKVTLVAR